VAIVTKNGNFFDSQKIKERRKDGIFSCVFDIFSIQSDLL
jgi:hypothetical protein